MVKCLQMLLAHGDMLFLVQTDGMPVAEADRVQMLAVESSHACAVLILVCGVGVPH